VAGGDVEIVASKQAITEVLYRYCRGLDRMDREMALAVWHAGGLADYGEHFKGTGEEFVEWVWKAHEGFHAHSHQITNVLIEIADDGDHAVSEAYVTVALRGGSTSEPLDIVDRGRYLDRWSRRDGRWAIDARQYVSDFQSVYPVPATGGVPLVGAASRRGPDDLSFALFGQ
jgi:hypothetical protein